MQPTISVELTLIISDSLKHKAQRISSVTLPQRLDNIRFGLDPEYLGYHVIWRNGMNFTASGKSFPGDLSDRSARLPSRGCFKGLTKLDDIARKVIHNEIQTDLGSTPPETQCRVVKWEGLSVVPNLFELSCLSEFRHDL